MLNKKAYVHIEDWRDRPLQGGRYPYVCVDGIYLRRSWGGKYENVAIGVAIAVNEDGFREALGAAEGMKEDKASWVSFFQWLRGRGLEGVKLIVGDKCLGMLEPGKFSSLQAVHKALFEDIYDFAGKLRTVNLAKGNFRFAPLMYLEAALTSIDRMPQSTFDEIIEKYVDVAHPFRKGNGRSARLMERSPIKDVEIKVLLRAVLTDDMNSREIFMKGIDHSYYYEGYTTFKAEEL